MAMRNAAANKCLYTNAHKCLRYDCLPPMQKMPYLRARRIKCKILYSINLGASFAKIMDAALMLINRFALCL